MTQIIERKTNSYTVNEITEKLTANGIRFEIQESRAGFVLIGMNLKPNKWTWFKQYVLYGIYDQPEYLFFDHTYCQNTGRVNKAKQHRWAMYNFLAKIGLPTGF